MQYDTHSVSSFIWNYSKSKLLLEFRLSHQLQCNCQRVGKLQMFLSAFFIDGKIFLCTSVQILKINIKSVKRLKNIQTTRLFEFFFFFECQRQWDVTKINTSWILERKKERKKALQGKAPVNRKWQSDAGFSPLAHIQHALWCFLCRTASRRVCDVVYQTFKRKAFLQLRPTLMPRLVTSFYSTRKSTGADDFHILTWQQIYVISVTSILLCTLPWKETSSFSTRQVSPEICDTLNWFRKSRRKKNFKPSHYTGLHGNSC